MLAIVIMTIFSKKSTGISYFRLYITLNGSLINFYYDYGSSLELNYKKRYVDHRVFIKLIMKIKHLRFTDREINIFMFEKLSHTTNWCFYDIIFLNNPNISRALYFMLREWYINVNLYFINSTVVYWLQKRYISILVINVQQ
jgi:hypothetical protein